MLSVLLLVCMWPSRAPAQSPVDATFDCGSVPQKTISTSMLMDGYCDCCNGADEQLLSDSRGITACPNTCGRDLQQLVDRLTAFELAHEAGARRAAALWNSQKRRVPELRKALFNNVQHATEAAELLHKRYEDTQKRLIHKRGKLTTAEYNAINTLHAQLQEMETSVQSVYTQANAKYGKYDRWMLASGHCASSAPISEKSSKGGSTTSIPKSYVYTVCFGSNVTQTEYLPDEWDLQDRLSKEQPIETELSAMGETHARNRTYGQRQMLGRWVGYLPMDDLDSHLWGSRTRFDGSEDRIPDVSLRPQSHDLGQTVMLYAGNDQCRSEGIVTSRKVYVFHVCANTSAEQLRGFEGVQSNVRAVARRFGQFSWNSAMSVDEDTGWMGSILNVHEDGLCTYKIYVSSILACSASIANTTRQWMLGFPHEGPG
jgi:hypothetical protein